MPGNATVKCPGSFGHLYIEVRRQNRKKPNKWHKLSKKCGFELQGGDVDKRSATVWKSTMYKNLCAGGYTLVLSPAGREAECDIEVDIERKSEAEATGAALNAMAPTSNVSIVNDTTQMQFFKFYPYELLVDVVAKDTRESLKGVTVKATRTSDGKQLKAKKTGRGGRADFGIVPRASQYDLEITLKGDTAKEYGALDRYGPAPARRVFNSPFVLEVDPICKVTPKIEVEYKTVLLDRALARYQEIGETKVYADPTYIKLSLAYTHENRQFRKGGTLKFAPENVDAFTDKDCTTKLADMKLTNGQLTSGLKLYLRGKTAGKFEVSLELEDPEDKLLLRDENPAKMAMGVVELKAQLHQHDIGAIASIQVDPDTDPIDTYYTNLKNQALPDQKAMTDSEKVKDGRLLHVQAIDDHGRAKLLVKKLDASQWPDGTDDYEVVLNATNASGAVAIYDKEFEGERQTADDGSAFPVRISVKVLKVKDTELWVQGSAATTKRCDVRVDVGLDRAEPLGKHATKEGMKRNGDWARFTVVQIREVKVDYTTPTDRATAWDSRRGRFYINLQPDPEGRKVTIQAQLSKKIKDVTIYFMLAEDANNRKAANWGKDMPTTWKWKGISADVKHDDKADRKDLLHLSARTDADGKAGAELKLSRFGGDVFYPGCYIDQDPHLAKYVAGHTDLSARDPVFAAGTITVWRKFWYKEVKVAGIDVAGFGDVADTYEDVKAEMVAATTVEMPLDDAKALSPPVIYKKHMVSFYPDNARRAWVNNYPNSTDDALVVGHATRRSFFVLATAEADKPVMIPMVNVHAMWIADGQTSGKNIPWFDTDDFPLSVTADKPLIDPPLQGGTLFASGQWYAMDWDPSAKSGAGDWANSRDGNIAAADIELDPGRSDPKVFKLKKPAGIAVSAHGTMVEIDGLTLRAGKTWLGFAYRGGIINSYSPNDEQDFRDTINHEVGHLFSQAARTSPTGIPAHPHQYDKNGSHCKYRNKSCLMYESSPQAAALHRYCPVCHPYVLVQDMSSVL